MNQDHKDPHEFDLTKPRLASYKQKKRRRHQDTVYGSMYSLLNEKVGVLSNTIERNHPLRFTRSLLYPESCCDGIRRSYIRESNRVTPTTIDDFHHNNLDDRIGFRSRWKQQRHPTNPTKTKNPIVKNGETRRWTRIDILFGHEDIKHSTRTVRPVGGQESIQSCVSMPINIEEEDQTRTGRPVDGPRSIQSCVTMPVQIVDKYEDEDQTRKERPVNGQESTQLEEIDIDFRVPGLSHEVVKEAEHFRVKKIESHPHREALQADLQQNNVYNPFSNNWKCPKLYQKYNVRTVFFIGIKELSTAFADNS